MEKENTFVNTQRFEMTEIITFKDFEHLTILDWIGISLLLNFLLFLGTIVIYRVLTRILKTSHLQAYSYPLTRTDFLLSLTTVLCNALVFLFAVYLWKYRLIVIHSTTSPLEILFEIIFYIILMDFLMYVFHYLAHHPFIYKRIHAKHHTHTTTNCLSLFVLHPVESIGFGLLMLSVIVVFSFSLPAIAIYVTINAVWGTIGHLNQEAFPKLFAKLGMGTTSFHNQHHLFEHKNYGFYTTFWDYLFGTLKE